MIKPIVIVGAGRQGRVIFDVFDNDDAASPVAGYLDDTKPVGEKVCGRPVLGGFAAMSDRAFVHDHAWVVAIGDNLIRQTLCRTLLDAGATMVNAAHPSARISRAATLGQGLYIGPLSSLGPGCTIGDWATMEGHGRVGGDVRIGEAVFLAPGVMVTGGSSIGARSFLGAGTIVSNNVAVGVDCVVGANSTVVRDLPDGTTAYGSPARPAPLTRRPFKRL
jgi:sugar O-acyltransferase (sialic acid O-acetyltransferase NeuD family)